MAARRPGSAEGVRAPRAAGRPVRGPPGAGAPRLSAPPSTSMSGSSRSSWRGQGPGPVPEQGRDGGHDRHPDDERVEQDRSRPRRRHHGDPHGGGQARSRPWSPRPPHRPAGTTGPRPDPPGTSQHAPRPGDAGHPPPRPLGSGGPASGGTRTNGPDPAAPRGPPAPGRDDDQHTPHRPPAARSSTGRRLPPARSRHPSTVGRTPTIPSAARCHEGPHSRMGGAAGCTVEGAGASRSRCLSRRPSPVVRRSSFVGRTSAVGRVESAQPRRFVLCFGL